MSEEDIVLESGESATRERAQIEKRVGRWEYCYGLYATAARDDVQTLLTRVQELEHALRRIANLQPNSGSSLDACIDIATEALRGSP